MYTHILMWCGNVCYKCAGKVIVYARTHARTCTRTNTHTCMIYVYSIIRTHTHTHTHTHTQLKLFRQKYEELDGKDGLFKKVSWAGKEVLSMYMYICIHVCMYTRVCL